MLSLTRTDCTARKTSSLDARYIFAGDIIPGALAALIRIASFPKQVEDDEDENDKAGDDEEGCSE
jgi:hypothetical protein